jgi:hypothetical protein
MIAQVKSQYYTPEEYLYFKWRFVREIFLNLFLDLVINSELFLINLLLQNNFILPLILPLNLLQFHFPPLSPCLTSTKNAIVKNLPL